MTAAGPDDLGSEHLAAVVRVLGLLGISPPKPGPHMLRRRFARVVTFNLAM